MADDVVEDIIFQWIEPEWPAPANIRALVTTRAGAVNSAPYNGFNTADHVGDCGHTVATNRLRLQEYFGWSSQPFWLNQVHGTRVVNFSDFACQTTGSAKREGEMLDADACSTRDIRRACVIHTADCLPVFFVNQQGTQVALAHAGWRGLLKGVLENTLAAFPVQDRVYAWMGPAISQVNFEVGQDVYSQFVVCDPAARAAFKATDNNKYLCDLYLLARQRLEQEGRCYVYGGGFCTYSEPRFFSFRETPRTGRMLSMVWIDSRQ